MLQLTTFSTRDSKIGLILSTPGGSVFHGLSIPNYLKGLPIEIDTYNFGSVDSIGVVIFQLGRRRYTVPHSRFLIHSVKFNINGQLSMDENNRRVSKKPPNRPEKYCKSYCRHDRKQLKPLTQRG